MTEKQRRKQKIIDKLVAKWYMKVHESPAGLLEFEMDQLTEAFTEVFEKGQKHK